ncbi:MAG: hypothetical protein ACTSSA_04785 [Candidatus Freyarchaeota archaeon]
MGEKGKRWGLIALIYKSNPISAEVDRRAPYKFTREFLDKAVSKRVKGNWIIVLYENPDVGLGLVKWAKEKGFKVEENQHFYHISI